MVNGVPCNQFGQQEPGSLTQIETFCKQNYGVTFLMTEKIDVKGKRQHPLYQWLTNKELNGVKSTTVRWNFQKYIIGRNGEFIDYFYSMTRPMSSKITINSIVMFKLFKKKTAVEKLQDRYKKLMSEWHDLSSTDRAASDDKYAQAQEVLNEIDKINV